MRPTCFTTAIGWTLVFTCAAEAQTTSPPGTPASQAQQRIQSISSQQSNQRQLLNDRDRRIAEHFRELLQSSVPPRGEVEFSPNRKPTLARTPAGSPKLTEKEKALLAALQSRIMDLDLKNVRFQDAIEYFQDYLKQPILVDRAVLDQAGVTYDSPVKARLSGVSARMALRKILADFGLTFVIRDETIQVVTLEQAKQMMVTRVVPVGDLAQGPFRAAQLIALIQSTMDPESWDVNGGLGSIRWHQPTRSLIIKQAAEFQPVSESTRIGK